MCASVLLDVVTFCYYLRKEMKNYTAFALIVFVANTMAVPYKRSLENLAMSHNSNLSGFASSYVDNIGDSRVHNEDYISTTDLSDNETDKTVNNTYDKDEDVEDSNVIMNSKFKNKQTDEAEMMETAQNSSIGAAFNVRRRQHSGHRYAGRRHYGGNSYRRIHHYYPRIYRSHYPALYQVGKRPC